MRIQGDWYNVDAFVDDVEREGLQIVCHGHCLFSDDYASPMYTWEMERVPMSERENNWHMRKNLVATNQEEMEALVAQGIEKGQTQISLWVPAYTADAFDFTFLRKDPRVKPSHIMTTNLWPRLEREDMYPTELIFVLEYK